MMGSQSRIIVAFVLLSVLIAACFAAPPAVPSQELQNGSDNYPIFEDNLMELSNDDEPHEEKRAVFRMGKRAMMRFGKRAVMRFGKRSVFRLG
uniref:CRE-FLP-11 protein n=1 Tax=Caenorhabditis tropicalis TaxID=1561998 RepID=A0A1I7TZS4_9PELO